MAKVKTPKKKLVLVWVHWFDASYQRGESTDDELTPRFELESGGLLVREDGESISIATDCHVDDRIWRHISHIPKPNIIRIRRFKL